jgi:dTDP-4-amino-4,6-dideoxygalactose transaminase
MPIFSEVSDNGCLSIEKIQPSYLVGCNWHRPDAIIPVNYLGQNAVFNAGFRYPDYRNRDIPVIEDAAQSFGGSCGFGDLTVFSFYATKNITCGEGGMIWTRDKELADKCRILSNNGQSNGAWSRYSSGPIDNYEVRNVGFKGNLPDILSAIGLAQLRRWPELKKKRDIIWKIYEQSFGKRSGSRHLFTIQVKNRAKIREQLYNEGIGTGVHYEALHLQPAYKYLGYKKGDFPMAEKIGEETLSLPVSNSMTEDDANYVVENVKKLIT